MKQVSLTQFSLSSVLFGLLLTQAVVAAPADDFVTTWKTDNPGPSNNTTIRVPMIGGPYDVDWDNDGIFDEFGISGIAVHHYAVAGTYTVRIRGSYDSIRFDGDGDKAKIISLDQWGTSSWKSMNAAFEGAFNLQVSATDAPDFSSLTDMSSMFQGATIANPDTSGWETSAVWNMLSMFAGATSANPDTSGWDTSAVRAMSSMFAGATSANPDTNGWDTSTVTNMRGMFFSAKSANPDTSGWDTSAVTDMSSMFVNATSANPDTSGWDTSAVVGMSGMFANATSANPDTSGWDTSAVRAMGSMFARAHLANPDTGGWDTSAVTNMRNMFDNATSADPDTSGWDTSNVIDMSSMFRNAYLANPDTSGWDTSAVWNMSSMFRDATSANPDTSSWDTATAKYMRDMFSGATSLNQDLGSWDVTTLKFASGMFDGVTLSTANYESVLIGWSAQELETGVGFSGGNSTYCSAEAVAARDLLIETFSWVITDGGQACPTDPPTGINATDGDYPNFVRITFNPVTGATVYRIYRCPDNGFTCGSPIGYPKTPTFDDSKGRSEQVYYYRVKACVANTCGKFSVADTGFTTPAPDQPTGIRATDGTYEDRVQVTFNTVDRATVYRVFRCPDRGYTCGLPIGYPKTGSFDDKAGDPGTVYYYRVRACTATTCGKFSVANTGHRGDISSSEVDAVTAFTAPEQEVPIPAMSTWGRWLLMLMTLGIGLLLIKRGSIKCQ